MNSLDIIRDVINPIKYNSLNYDSYNIDIFSSYNTANLKIDDELEI